MALPLLQVGGLVGILFIMLLVVAAFGLAVFLIVKYTMAPSDDVAVFRTPADAEEPAVDSPDRENE